MRSWTIRAANGGGLQDFSNLGVVRGPDHARSDTALMILDQAPPRCQNRWRRTAGLGATQARRIRETRRSRSWLTVTQRAGRPHAWAARTPWRPRRSRPCGTCPPLLEPPPRPAGRRRLGRPTAAGAPATTSVISPRGSPSAAQVTRSRERRRGGPPRRSWSAPGRPPRRGPRRTPPPASARVAAIRCGASKNTSVRVSAASAASAGPALAGLARQEALEAEPVAGQAGQRERGGHGARPGRGGDRHAGLDRGPDQPVTRGRRRSACRRR